MVKVLDIFDLSKQVSSDADPLFVEALEKKAEITRQLIAEFVRMSGTALSHDEMYEKYQQSQTEVRSSHRAISLALTAACSVPLFVQNLPSPAHSSPTRHHSATNTTWTL